MAAGAPGGSADSSDPTAASVNVSERLTDTHTHGHGRLGGSWDSSWEGRGPGEREQLSSASQGQGHGFTGHGARWQPRGAPAPGPYPPYTRPWSSSGGSSARPGAGTGQWHIHPGAVGECHSRTRQAGCVGTPQPLTGLLQRAPGLDTQEVSPGLQDQEPRGDTRNHPTWAAGDPWALPAPAA